MLSMYVCIRMRGLEHVCARTHVCTHTYTHTYIYWLTHKDAAFAIANPRKDVIPPAVDLMSFLQSE